MIRKSILITGVLCATISFGQTTIQMNLKGKVKSIQEVHEKCPAIALAGSPIECVKNETFYFFDKKGFVLEPQKESLNDYIVEKTTTKEGYILTKYLEWDGVKRKHFEEYYNKKNIQTKVRNYHADGEIIGLWEFVYNEKGRKTEQKLTNIWNGTTKVYHHFYNEQGDIVMSKFYENGELIKEENNEISYKFDKKGNWVSKAILGGHFQTYNRTITYY